MIAIEGMQNSIVDSFSSLGANSFDVKSKRQDGRRSRGLSQQQEKTVKYEEAIKFKDKFEYSNEITIHAGVSWNVEAKRLSKKANPNTRVYGADDSIS